MGIRRGSLLSAMAALLLTACAKEPVRQAAPPVFIIRDTDTTIYLTGTVHLLPDGLAWRSPAVTRAMAAADTLVTELPQAELDRVAEVAPRFARAARAIPVPARLAPDLRDDFARLADDLPSASELAALDDWAVAVMLAQVSAREAGAEAGNGMDSGLADAFRRAGKPHTGLETAANQFAAFDAIPLAEQRLMLNRLVCDMAAGIADDRLRATIDAWAAGDLDRIAAIIEDDRTLAPGAHRVMLVARNARWRDWIAARMARPGTILIAVGSGHLAGPDSLIALLAERGIRAERVPG